MILRNLLLTIAIESAVAYLLQLRRWQHYLLFACINIGTNLSAQFLLRFLAAGMGFSPLFQALGVFIECVVFLLEALLLKRFAKDLPVSPWTLSAYANLLTTLIGMLFQIMV